jgi:amidase
LKLNELSASRIAGMIAAGETSAEAVVEACLARIAEREPQVHAWAFIDPAQALEEARRLDRSQTRGPLHGVPIAVKDIIDTCDMPTGMGSPIFAGFRPRADAACVALVRNAGAVILGKTVTAEFASSAPGVTVNPHNHRHTPGGSSSGSAAAVADHMTPVAFGTQTGGSVLRPSAYCGIVGYRPTFGTFNLAGVKPAAQSLDTLGLHARSLDDIELVAAVLVGRQPEALAMPTAPPAIGVCRTPLWRHALPETVAAVEDAAERLAAAGSTAADVELPEEFDRLDTVRMQIQAYERSRATTWEWTHHKELLGDLLRDEIERGLSVSFEAYTTAMQQAETFRRLIDEAISPYDLILAPCSDGAAPEGIASTGNARFQGFWTILRLPAVTLPTHSASNALPVGIQLIGHRFADRKLLGLARWAFQTLGQVVKRT